MQTVLKFLKQLSTNNNKDWFEANKALYLQAKQEFEEHVDKIIIGIAKFDKKIQPSLTAKQCVFRIYKDVRFSKDKSPYKTNMGASINPGGKKSLIAGYYLHCEPGKSFLAGGVYMPTPELLQAIRQEIDYHPKPISKILSSPSFKKYFNGIDGDDKLKTSPKGYESNHPQIELLKNRHFTVSHELNDKQINDIKFINSGFKAMMPFLEYLRVPAEK